MWHAGAPLMWSLWSDPAQQVNAWELLSKEMQTGPNGQMNINLYAEGKGSVWFDDFSVTKARTREQRRSDLAKVVEGTGIVAIEEEIWQACMDLGQILLWIDKDLESSLSRYSKALELAVGDKKRTIMVLSNIAEIHRQQKDLSAALKDYNKLIELDPEDTIKLSDPGSVPGRQKALRAIAEIYREQKNEEKLEAAARKFIDACSSSGTILAASELMQFGDALAKEAAAMLEPGDVQPDDVGVAKVLGETVQMYVAAVAVYEKMDATAYAGQIAAARQKMESAKKDIARHKKSAGIE